MIRVSIWDEMKNEFAMSSIGKDGKLGIWFGGVL